MKENSVALIVIVDRSGSMQNIAKDMEGGLNTFLKEQKELEGECLVTLAQFDSIYELVYANKPIKNVGKYKLEPRGGTALLDAIGQTINRVGATLSSLPEWERPSQVRVIIITDGEENSSHEFKLDQIKSMIKHQTDKYNWEFTYLGANQDAINVAGGLGLGKGAALTYNATREGTRSMFDSMGKDYTMKRSGAKAVGSSCFTDEQRANAVKE